MKNVIVTTPHELKSLFSEVLANYYKEREESTLAALKGLTAQKKYYSRADTAKQLGITLPTLDKYTKIGIIQSHRIGNRVLYKMLDIENAIVNRKF